MPDRILTDDDCARIVAASIDPDRVLGGIDGHDGGPADVLLTTVEGIVAEHTQALRAEVERLRTWWEQDQRRRAEIEQILDRVLGTEATDGAGAGLVADVELLARRAEAAVADRDRLRDCYPEGWEHTSPADLLLSVLIDADRQRREEAP